MARSKSGRWFMCEPSGPGREVMYVAARVDAALLDLTERLQEKVAHLQDECPEVYYLSLALGAVRSYDDLPAPLRLWYEKRRQADQWVELPESIELPDEDDYFISWIELRVKGDSSQWAIKAKHDRGECWTPSLPQLPAVERLAMIVEEEK